MANTPTPRPKAVISARTVYIPALTSGIAARQRPCDCDDDKETRRNSKTWDR